MRVAACKCRSFTAECEGEPRHVSVCHCLDCQRRTGSAFGVQARFPKKNVTLYGACQQWERTGESGRLAKHFFCPTCGSTVVYENEDLPNMVAIPVGAFADPGFPFPQRSIFESRKHGWVEITDAALRHHAEGDRSDGFET
ncbi:GFA family protein [Agrobacterium vitis]|uniref:GFA family protein n=1 Tax=Agrobacterium vitis TaxID=373 RepID=UPI0015728ADF|nr:GFA family protein [Agrobacterium vitis]NSY14820.1 GFA family protein [Agrobacterium vitis]NSY24577.1 GFA family protein [Agrobacterium vitis]WEO75205.1 GFA family protein [Agrobacterium vitis]